MLHCPDMPVARLLYTLLLAVASPAAALFLLWRSRRHPGYREHWGERFFGLAPTSVDAGGSVWIHAVSVGETRAAQPLVEALLEQHPDLRILLTHGTPTGRQIGVELFGDRVTRAYLPYDLPWAVATFLDRQRPALGLLIETEVWPNLVAACRARGVPLCLVNARLSERSYRGYRRLAALAGPAFRSLTRVLAQTPADADRIVRLGLAMSESLATSSRMPTPIRARSQWVAIGAPAGTLRLQRRSRQRDRCGWQRAPARARTKRSSRRRMPWLRRTPLRC